MISLSTFVISINTFETVKFLLNIAKENVKPTTIVTIVGCKCDLESEYDLTQKKSAIKSGEGVCG